MPNDTYLEIRKMWMEEWKQARANSAKHTIMTMKIVIPVGVACLAALLVISAFALLRAYQTGENHWLGLLAIATVLILVYGLMLRALFEILRHPDKHFRLEPENFATFWWYSRLEEPVVSETAHEILSRVEDGNEPTEAERSAIIQIAAEALMDLRRDYAWGSPTQKIIGLRAVNLSTELVRYFLVKTILDTSPATNGDSVSSSTKDFDPA